MRLERLSVLLVLAIAASGCERAPKTPVGTWSAEEGEEWVVRINEDSTWTMLADGMRGQGEYEEREDGSLRLVPEGRMAEVMPGGFTATVVRDSMELCSPAGCTALFRGGQ
jgi:hypothetical protein